MKRTLCAATALTLVLGLAGAASAQPNSYDRNHQSGYTQDNRNDDHRGDVHDNRNGDKHANQSSHYVTHPEWRKGHRISRNDWSRGERVDYRSHKLRAPPRGYEWREVDGNYVMAAIATGLIASIIANNH